jgi:hypothetical protein
MSGNSLHPASGTNAKRQASDLGQNLGWQNHKKTPADRWRLSATTGDSMTHLLIAQDHADAKLTPRTPQTANKF